MLLHNHQKQKWEARGMCRGFQGPRMGAKVTEAVRGSWTMAN